MFSPSSALNGVLIGLLLTFGSALLVAIISFVLYFFRYTSPGRIFLDRIGRPGDYDDEQAFAREEADALEQMDDSQHTEYMRAKAFIQANPPESIPTDISLSQYLAIQEKGVSAWEFEPELEIANCFVEARTEIEFFDSECTVMSNLPVPKQNEVYYWEAKVFEKPENTLISIGMATKPYPLFRLPGFHKHSIAYLSSGVRRHNQPFMPVVYGPQFVQGDVVGVGYRPRSGTIFFTRNGKRLEDVAHGLKSQNFFPAVGANGPCVVHVNFGQAGFVFIEANVKKWGLAPQTGSLAPPPPYGSEHGSILLETGYKDDSAGTSQRAYAGRSHRSQSESVHGRARRGTAQAMAPPPSPGPLRSPTEISLTHLTPSEQWVGGAGSSTHAAVRNTEHSSETVAGLLPPRNSLLQTTHSPPPEYTSPAASDAGSRRSSSDDERSPFLDNDSHDEARARRSDQSSAVPPIPSYEDAMQQGSDSNSILFHGSENSLVQPR